MHSFRARHIDVPSLLIFFRIARKALWQIFLQQDFENWQLVWEINSCVLRFIWVQIHVLPEKKDAFSKQKVTVWKLLNFKAGHVQLEHEFVSPTVFFRLFFCSYEMYCFFDVSFFLVCATVFLFGVFLLFSYFFRTCRVLINPAPSVSPSVRQSVRQ